MARSFSASRSVLVAGLRSSPPRLVDAVMASPPTIGALATSSAIASGKSWASTNGPVTLDFFSYRAGGAIQVAGGVFPDYNYVCSKSITNAADAAARAPFCVDFVFSGTTLEVMFKGVTSSLRIRVDGELVSATATAIGNTGSTYYLPVTFASRANRKISLEFSSNAMFGGVTTGPNDTIVRWKQPGPRCIVLGDSFTEGTGADAGAASGWVRSFGESLGWADTWASGLGSTGYLATVSSKATFRQRVQTDLINQSPDAWVIAGGFNDYATYTGAQIGAEAALLFAQIKAALPNSAGIVLSPFWRSGVDNAPYTLWAARDAIKAAAVAAGLVFVDVLEMPLDGAGTPVSTTLAASALASATTISSTARHRVGATVAIGSGAALEHRVVTSSSGTGPYTHGVAALTYAHAAAEPVVEVGACLWTGTGRVGATTGTGNSDLLVSSDSTHPTQAGHDLLGATVASLMRAAL